MDFRIEIELNDIHQDGDVTETVWRIHITDENENSSLADIDCDENDNSNQEDQDGNYEQIPSPITISSDSSSTSEQFDIEDCLEVILEEGTEVLDINGDFNNNENDAALESGYSGQTNDRSEEPYGNS